MWKRTLLVLISLALTVYSASFVTRQGNKLFLNGTHFRYAGANMYWLGLDENVGGINYPTNFRVDDAFATAIEMGATAVRGHTLGISTGNPKSYEISLNRFQEVAIDYIDYAVWRAGVYGIKLVIPLTDNYHYYHGGKHDFTDWRGLSESEFYVNNNVISDFKQYIFHLLTHQNNYTKIALRDDPTIMAWETGNEIQPPAYWTQNIADYIKSIDPNHLVMDGTYGINSDALKISSVDIYSDHFYPMDPDRASKDASIVSSAGKVFIVGEYGWSQGDLSGFLNTIENNDAISGDTYWSLFPHADNYGFVRHNDGFTLHYPGDTADMMYRVQLLRQHAYRMRGETVPKHKVPLTPLITSISGSSIAWRGAAGAAVYSVDRSSDQGKTWTTICDACANDNDTPWIDRNQPSGTIWYRVVGINLDKIMGPYSPVAIKQ